MKKNVITLVVFFLFPFGVANAETLKGTFTRGFEKFEITVDGKETYFIEDPKKLIRNLDISKKNEKNFWASFPLCIEGKISKKGGYGPSGKYDKKIRIYKICN